jgi:hypothetical protein
MELADVVQVLDHQSLSLYMKQEPRLYWLKETSVILKPGMRLDPRVGSAISYHATCRFAKTRRVSSTERSRLWITSMSW